MAPRAAIPGRCEETITDNSYIADSLAAYSLNQRFSVTRDSSRSHPTRGIGHG